MGTQRFMYLNNLSHANLKRHATSMGLLFANDADHFDGSNADSSAMHRQAILTKKLFFDSTQRRWSGVVPKSQFSFLDADHPIRYCPQCLTGCFHSMLFQFPIVQACPYHSVPLLNCCQRCGKSVANLNSEPGRAQALFCCENCGAPFAQPSQLINGVLSGISDGLATFEVAHRIIASMCTVDVTELTGQMAMRASFNDDFARFFSHALFAVANPGIAKPPWLLGLESEVSVHPISSKTRDTCSVEKDQDAAHAMPITIVQRLSELREVLSSLDIELSAQVQGICGHPYPRLLGVQVENIAFSGKEYCLEMHSHDCPCCAVLCWWRACFRPYFGFTLNSLDRGNPPRLADHEAWLGALLPLEQETLCRDALALFAGLSAQMWEWLSPVNERQEIAMTMYKAVSARKVLGSAGYRLRELIEQHKQGSDALDLTLHRHHVVAPEMHCTLGQAEFRVSYTVVQGLKYLKSCHRLRQQGALWKSNNSRQDAVYTSSQHDRWYSDLAKECSLRLWHELFRNQQLINLRNNEAAQHAKSFEQPI